MLLQKKCQRFYAKKAKIFLKNCFSASAAIFLWRQGGQKRTVGNGALGRAGSETAGRPLANGAERFEGNGRLAATGRRGRRVRKRQEAPRQEITNSLPAAGAERLAGTVGREYILPRRWRGGRDFYAIFRAAAVLRRFDRNLEYLCCFLFPRMI